MGWHFLRKIAELCVGEENERIESSMLIGDSRIRGCLIENPRFLLCSNLIPCVKLIIPSLLFNKLVVGTSFNNASLLQNHNAVGVADCGKPVSNDKGGSALHQVIHAFLNQ